jgi:hypothetical protein
MMQHHPWPSLIVADKQMYCWIDEDGGRRIMKAAEWDRKQNSGRNQW